MINSKIPQKFKKKKNQGPRLKDLEVFINGQDSFDKDQRN